MTDMLVGIHHPFALEEEEEVPWASLAASVAHNIVLGIVVCTEQHTMVDKRAFVEEVEVAVVEPVVDNIVEDIQLDKTVADTVVHTVVEVVALE
jgi:hypothetical protein